jgi:putative heme-binding domain-containing protein
VGPGLETITDRSPEAFLSAILDPNRAFESKYASYTVATTDGRVLEGLIAAETSSGITLRRQEGKEDALLREEIEEMAASGQSLMPEGLEKDMTPRELADVVAYLNSKVTPGGATGR